MASEEYLQRQRESIRSFRVDADLKERLGEFAEMNTVSQSEVVCDAMRMFIDGTVPPPRQTTSARLSAWVPPELYVEFRKAAEKQGVPVVRALTASLEEIL